MAQDDGDPGAQITYLGPCHLQLADHHADHSPMETLLIIAVMAAVGTVWELRDKRRASRPAPDADSA